MKNRQRPLRIQTLWENNECESVNSCCWWFCNFIKWFFSVLIWGSIIVLKCGKDLYYFIIILIISYVVYLFLEIFSPTPKFLLSKSKKNFEETISDLSKEFPSVSFYSRKDFYNEHIITTKGFPYVLCLDKTKKLILIKKR